jgi:uncharacterized protein (AIM24 family)
MPSHCEARYVICTFIRLQAFRIQTSIKADSLPGAMIAMTPTITLKGQMKFSLKKALIGGDMAKSVYTGPGELLLAPASIGDITIIKLGGSETWSVGKDAFLACTQGIVSEYKSQGVTKAMFSGEGLFVYKISGQGILWCTSFGAIIRKDVGPFECVKMMFRRRC